MEVLMNGTGIFYSESLDIMCLVYFKNNKLVMEKYIGDFTSDTLKQFYGEINIWYDASVHPYFYHNFWEKIGEI